MRVETLGDLRELVRRASALPDETPVELEGLGVCADFDMGCPQFEVSAAPAPCVMITVEPEGLSEAW